MATAFRSWFHVGRSDRGTRWERCLWPAGAENIRKPSTRPADMTWQKVSVNCTVRRNCSHCTLECRQVDRSTGPWQVLDRWHVRLSDPQCVRCTRSWSSALTWMEVPWRPWRDRGTKVKLVASKHREISLPFFANLLQSLPTLALTVAQDFHAIG